MTQMRSGEAVRIGWIQRMRAIARPLRRAVVHFFRTMRQHLRIRMYVIEGKEKASGKKLTLVFGGRRRNLEYLIHAWFEDSPGVREAGECWIWKALGRCRKDGLADCLLVLDMHKRVYRLFAAKRGVFVPHWIGGEVLISEAVERSKKIGNIKEDLRRIRKNKLEYEVTKDAGRFESFYREMYVPYMKSAYGERAFLMPHREMLEQMSNGELLVVTKDGEDIAAAIVLRKGDRARAWSVGVKNGDRAYVKQGALAALYYFEVMYARDKGCASLHFGGSRAFLRDGVLHFKKKWGMRITESTRTGFVLFPSSLRPGLRSLLQTNPFIYCARDAFEGAVFVECEEMTSEEDVGRIYKNYFLPGMDKVEIYRMGDHGKTVIPDELSEYVVFASVGELFRMKFH